MAPVKLNVPLPAFVNVFDPLMMPLKVNVPVFVTLVLPAKLIVPASELVLLAVINPVFDVIASAPMATPAISNVAPDEMVVPAAVVPNAVACPADNVPALMVVAPL